MDSGVLSHNHDLKIAAIRVERARTEARMSTFASRPKLDASVSGEKRQSNFIGLPFGGGGISSSRYESYGISAGLNWELDLWGGYVQVTRLREPKPKPCNTI